jgi:transaldolase
MRELFLDSANLDDIRQMVKTEAIQGVTTNPSLMAKEAKGGYTERLLEICDIISNTERKMHLSVEVITSDPEKMIYQAMTLAHTLKNPRVDLHIKIPLMLETLPVITELLNKKVKVNATACMTALQAKLAEDAGAPIVSFFYNRMLDGGEKAEEEISRFCNGLGRSAQVICGSIRKPEDVRRCWLAGARIVTASMKVIKEMVSHPQTDKAIQQFQQDIDAWLR